MPAPASATYSVAALSAAHAAFRDLIDAGTGPGEIRLRDAADTLLATVMLDDPCGAINGATGALHHLGVGVAGRVRRALAAAHLVNRHDVHGSPRRVAAASCRALARFG